MKIFLSYARGDDEPFVRRLYEDLTKAKFDVWFDRVNMPSRGLTFHQEIREAITQRDRLLLVVGPQAVKSEYVRQEWQYAWFDAEKVVTPILRLGDYPLPIPELALLHCEDFRNDAEYQQHLKELIRILQEPVPPMGQVIGAPALPAHFLTRTDRLISLRDALRSGLDSPAPLGGTAIHHQFHGIASVSRQVGLHGMGGIGKSVLANLLARDREVRKAFPDGIVWIGLGSLPNITSLMQRVHQQLGGDGLFTSEHEGQQKLKEILANKAVLLVIDDVWHRKDVDAFNVLGPRCRALITTRDAQLLTSMGSTPHLLQLLTDDEALRLLATTIGQQVSQLPPEAHLLLRECGRLPLAVALAGGMIAADNMPWAKLLTAFQRHRLEFFRDDQRNPQHQDLLRMIEVSVQTLSSVEQSRLIELGVFPQDEAVPETTIVTLWEHSGSLDDLDTTSLLNRLKQRSLIQITKTDKTPAGSVGEISLHSLIQDYCLARAIKELGGEAALHQKLLDAYQNRCLNGWWSGPNDGYYFQHLRHHLIAAGRDDEALALLMNFDWLQAKTHAGLISDLCHEMFEAGQATDLLSTDGLGWWYYFVRSNPQFLHQYPHCFFQQAFNEPVDSPVSRAAQQAWSAVTQGIVHVPHVPIAILEWTNRHQDWQPPACLMTLIGHTALIGGVACSPDGRILVSGDQDRTVKVWDAQTGAGLHTLTGHTGWVRSVACSADGMTVVSGAEDEAAKVWDAQRGECRHTLTGHTGYVLSVAFATDGKTLVTGSKDNTVKIWSSSKGACLQTLIGHRNTVNSVACSGDARVVVSGSDDGDVRVWDSETGQCLLTLSEHEDRVYSVAVTVDGRMIISGSQDKKVKVWDARSGACLRTFTGHKENVTSVACSADGRIIISASRDMVRLWDIQTGACLRTLINGGSLIACSADGRMCVSNADGYTVKVWDIMAEVSRPPLAGHAGCVTKLDCSEDGRMVFSGSYDGTVEIWDVPTGNCLRTLPRHNRTGWDHTIRSLACTGDGQTLVSLSGRMIKFWNVETGECRLTNTITDCSPDAVAFSADERLLYSWPYDECLDNHDNLLKVWDTETGACLATHPKKSNEAQTLLAEVLDHSTKRRRKRSGLSAEVVSGNLVVNTFVNVPGCAASATVPTQQLTAPGPFWNALGPLFEARIVAFTASGESHWFRIRHRNET